MFSFLVISCACVERRKPSALGLISMNENRVRQIRFPCTEIESVRLDFHVQKLSPMNSISRPTWTSQLSKIESSGLELLETKLVSNVA